MKQTKKLTRNHRQALSRMGYKDQENIRFYRETPTLFEFYDTKEKKIFTVDKMNY